jgi:hypothetical protein
MRPRPSAASSAGWRIFRTADTPGGPAPAGPDDGISQPGNFARHPRGQDQDDHDHDRLQSVGLAPRRPAVHQPRRAGRAFTPHQRSISRGLGDPSRRMSAAPVEDDARRKLVVVGPDGMPAPDPLGLRPAGQSGRRAGRIPPPLPADIAADALNYGIFKRPVEDTGHPAPPERRAELAAVTGPRYGRVWNADVAKRCASGSATA